MMAFIMVNNARAATQSLITTGFGAGFGVSSHSQTSGADLTFSNELSMRFKALYVLGMEIAWSPTDGFEGAENEMVFQNELRFSGLLYVIPTPYVSGYLKGGIEGDSIKAVFSVTDPSNSYHTGGGLDVEVTDNIVVQVEFLLLIPGAHSIQEKVNTYIQEETARTEAALKTGDVPADIGAGAPEISDFISTSNYRFTLGVRYFF